MTDHAQEARIWLGALPEGRDEAEITRHAALTIGNALLAVVDELRAIRETLTPKPRWDECPVTDDGGYAWCVLRGGHQGAHSWEADAFAAGDKPSPAPNPAQTWAEYGLWLHRNRFAEQQNQPPVTVTQTPCQCVTGADEPWA